MWDGAHPKVNSAENPVLSGKIEEIWDGELKARSRTVYMPACFDIEGQPVPVSRENGNRAESDGSAR